MNTGIFNEVPQSPMQSLVRARARSVFGVPMPKFLSGVAQGIGSYDPQGGFFGNFARGLSGSLQGGMGFDQLARQRQMEDARFQTQVEQDSIQEEIARERLGLDRQRVDMERERLNRPSGPNEINSIVELFLHDPAKAEALLALQGKYRPPDTPQPSVSERQDATIAEGYGLDPGDVTGLRAEGGFTPFTPFRVGQTPNPNFGIRGDTQRMLPDTTWMQPSEPQRAKQLLDAIRQSQDYETLSQMAQHPDPRVAKAAKNRIVRLKLSPAPKPPKRSLFSTEKDR